MDMAFRNRRGRWELDGHELTGGSIVQVNLDSHWIGASVEHDNNRLRDYCLLLNGQGMLLMPTTMKLRRRAATGKRND